ncbi:FLUCTUATING-LIGHT-ACCLIMATION protein 1, chloroplastic [Solanum lycopersicum]|uniref:FLUCTUATING-LIGHT-ACCLIMATION protein 1, chloroplastic n=1 Tax=Solanum lycopersicum TaxID=4081 RepID=UPI003748D81F
MAAAPFLLESNLKWNPLFYTPNPIQCTRLIHYQKLTPSKFSKTSKLTVKCFSKNHKNVCFNDGDGLEVKNKENPFEIVVKSVMKALKALQKPAVAAVLVGLLLMYDPNSALAASGGRIGGKSFSSSRSSAPSRGYSMRTAEPSFSYSAPYYAPSPFGFSGGGVYVGPAVGFGSSAFLVMMGFAAFIMVSGFLSDRSEGSVLTATGKTSVLKLQVGLLGLGRSLQKDLNRIAEVADTSTPEGLSFVLTETTLALLRHPGYCISAYSSVDVKRSMEEGENRFNQLSIEERGKFDEETLVNVNNIRRKSSTSQRATGFSNEYIVVTILVAAEGAYKLPTINGSGDLKEALQKIASIPSSRTLAVEILWTPQNENDTLSERQLLEDYPLLRPL